MKLNVKYCLADHVGKKRNDFLIYKGKFLSRIQQIKHMGQRQKLLHNLANWIEEEIDNMQPSRFIDLRSSRHAESQVKINKKKLKDTLLQQAEKLVREKNAQIRMSQVENIKNTLFYGGLTYEKKNNMIESQIMTNFQFFSGGKFDNSEAE